MEQYKSPVTPEGFDHISGTWDSCFVIRSRRDGSEFVWIPVGALPQDGQMYGEVAKVAFGRRDHGKRAMYRESMTDELRRQIESVEKYGGFYLSRYDVSMSATGAPCSVMQAEPWTMVNLAEAQRIAASYLHDGTVTSHLPYAAEIDSMLSWLLDGGHLSKKEAAAYVDDIKVFRADRKKKLTGGSGEKKGLFDLDRNVDAWVQESRDFALFRCSVCVFPQTSHCYYRPYSCYTFAGFRMALTLL